MNIVNVIQHNMVVLGIVSFCFGSIIGSFLNVVIYRLPIMLKNEWLEEYADFLKVKIQPHKQYFNLFLPASHCPTCKQNIPFYRNIPLVSFILQAGKCNTCGAIISWRYPLVELLTAIITMFTCLTLGVTIQSLLIVFLSWGLIAATFIDLQEQLLPDSIVLSLLWLGLFVNTFNILTTPQNAIIGAIAGYLSLWLVAMLFKLVRKIDGMGHGDFKLFALFGAWLGWKFLPLIILIASFTGTIVGLIWIVAKKYNLQKPLPFGPYLALAGWITIFWGEKILNWYVSILNFRF